MRPIRNVLTLLSVALAGAAVTGCADLPVASDSTALGPAVEGTHEVVLISEVKWEPLNPARGDKSPKAATLWGDRNGSGPTGFLVQFVDGFSSPPHIHNVSYRGVVIHGLVHNDDPSAADMWMPAGWFWTQPKGGVHITAAKGSRNVAYIEIEEGPYLVLPPEKAFDSGEAPINVDVSNFIWLGQPGMPASADGPKVAFLWGSPQGDQLNGALVKLPAGFAGTIRSRGSSFRAVVIRGRPKHRAPGETDLQTLEPGSYFSSKGESVHHVSCEAGDGCIIYVRMKGEFDVVPQQP